VDALDVLGQADAKRAFEEGRKLGSKDKKPRRRKPPQVRQNEREYLADVARGRGELGGFETDALLHFQQRGFKFKGQDLTESSFRDFARAELAKSKPKK
jgi:hypothetical protein